MKILFVYSGSENIGIEYLSSVLKEQGHSVHLLFDPAVFSGNTAFHLPFISFLSRMDAKIVKKAIIINPDIVAFSVFTGNYRWSLEIARKIKKILNVPVIFGGVHASAVPDEVISMDCVDYVIIGEGEKAFPKLVKHLQFAGKNENLFSIENLVFKADGGYRNTGMAPYIRDLDSLPFPDKDLFYSKIPLFRSIYMISASRGCPYSCSYCSNDLYRKLYKSESNHIRRRSPENVIQELSQIENISKVKLISFTDDVFTSSRSWLERFLPLYKDNIGIPFFCSAHPNNIDYKTAALLKLSGCRMLTLGVQSGSPEIRKTIFQRDVSDESIIEAAEAVKSNNIVLSVDFIFGAPEETPVDLDKSYELLKRIKPDRVLTFWMTYYPGTEILEIAKKKSLLTTDDINRIKKGYTGVTHSTGSVPSGLVPLYRTYAILFQLACLIEEGLMRDLMNRLVKYLPLKAIISRFLMFINAVRICDYKTFFFIRLIFTFKKCP